MLHIIKKSITNIIFFRGTDSFSTWAHTIKLVKAKIECFKLDG